MQQGGPGGSSKESDGGGPTSALERDFRSYEAGGAFGHPELLDIDWAFDTTWSVLHAVRAESSRPMATGTSRCRAYAFLLRGGDGATPWGAVAVFCDEQGLLAAETKRGGKSIVTWPLMAHAVKSKLEIRAAFVDAIEPAHQALWISEKSWSDDGYLVAMEYAYQREGLGLRKILQAVGADPASYADKGGAFNRKQADDVRNSYESGFVGTEYPRRFRTSHLYRGRPSELIYELDPRKGSYASTTNGR